MNQLSNDISAVLNKHCQENNSNTPDFILADYLLNCLRAFEAASQAREQWYNVQHSVINEPLCACGHTEHQHASGDLEGTGRHCTFSHGQGMYHCTCIEFNP